MSPFTEACAGERTVAYLVGSLLAFVAGYCLGLLRGRPAK